MGRYTRRNEAEDRMVEKLDYKRQKKAFDELLALEFEGASDKELDHKKRKMIMADLAMRHLTSNMADSLRAGDRKQQEYYARTVREYCVEKSDKVKDAVVDSMKFLCEAVALTRGMQQDTRLIEAVVTPKKKGKKDGREEGS